MKLRKRQPDMAGTKVQGVKQTEKIEVEEVQSMRVWRIPALPNCNRVSLACRQNRAQQAGLCLATLLLNVSLASSALAQTTAPATSAPHPANSTHRRPSLDDRVKTLAAALKLDDAQQVAVKKILQQRQEEILRLRHDTSIAGSTRIERLRALQNQTVQRIRLVLNDEQKKQYDPIAIRKTGSAPEQKSVEDWLKVTTPR